MVQIRIWSDLHLDVGTWDESWFDGAGGQILVLAGDVTEARWISREEEFFQKCSSAFAEVVYVFGNHEYWGGCVQTAHQKAQEWFIERGISNVHILGDNAVTLEGVRFIGTTLWYDARSLIGQDKRALSQISNDYRRIVYRNGESYHTIRPHEVVRLHCAAVDAIKRSAETGEPTVIITHHAPSSRSADPCEMESIGYTNELCLSDFAVGVWIHGHVHHSLDYLDGGMRVICNPRGYQLYNEINPNFDPHLTLTVNPR